MRHHSPTAAHVLAQVIAQRRPKLLFLEGPAGMEALLPTVCEQDSRPPIALYSSFRDDDYQLAAADLEQAEPLQLASWYPLLSYSPEYVAIKAAASIGAELVLIDLPHYAQFRLNGEAEAEAVDDEAAIERALEHSRFYQGLARAGGFRRWNEAWDTLFEHGALDVDVEDYRRSLALFCAAARATYHDDEAAVTRARERFMWRRIQAQLQERGIDPGQAMVVCGGFHLFLDRHDSDPLPEIPLGTVHQALVPYSYLRFAEQAGYGAGNRAPRFYHTLYESIRRGAPQTAITTHSIEILQAARRRGERLASADAIAVEHHCHLLAQLRGRQQPTLDDLDDALITCCVKGDPDTDGARLRKIMLETHIGNRVGRVSARAGRLPLVSDYYRQLDRLELASLVEHEQVSLLNLDLRQPLDRARSAFLHRLRQIGVGLGELRNERDVLGNSIFKERWRLSWNVKLEAALIERSLDGDTVVAAALTSLTRVLSAVDHDAARSCRLLYEALAMDLPDIIARAAMTCSEAVDNDSRFVALADALATLRVLERSLHSQALREGQLAELLLRTWDRACFALPEVHAAPREQHAAIIDALKGLAELALARDDLDPDLFAASVHSAADMTPVAELRGAFLAILVEIRRLEFQLMADELAAFADTSEERQLLAGDFLHGVLSVSTTALLLGADALVRAIDHILLAVRGEVFLAMLPRLRAAVELLHARHRDALCEAVARQLGLKEHRLDRPLRSSAAAQALIVELDREAAEIMAEWEL
nr:DUF5682 family protein [Pseudomarimonas arenosa]